MNKKALKTLEYNKIIEQLTACATSSQGKRLCQALLPQDDIVTIERMQEETQDALSRIYQKGSLSFAGVKDIRGSLKRLEIGEHPWHRGAPCHLFSPGEYQPGQILRPKRR